MMARTTLDRILATTKALERFWKNAHGWAPKAAANMLASARLDRQVSFTHTLSDYLEPFSPEEAEARIILGYVTLRSLCEGVLKLFCSGLVKQPREVGFDRLIAFYALRIDKRHEAWLRRVQKRGNAIHHFKDLEIGSQADLIADIGEFLEFLLAVNARLPYPDDLYNPALA